MKKLIAILAAAALALISVSALAFTGYTADPGMPAVNDVEEEFFPVELHRMENDPVIEETPWGETMYTWVYAEDDAPIAVGDTVTVSCEFAVPASISGFGAEMLNEIKVIFDFDGLEDIEIVTAEGCDANIECDYDAGYCYPLPGYSNANIEGSALIVDAHLNTNFRVILRGTASANMVECENSVTIGQHELPAHFSVGKLYEVSDGVYYVYEKDVMNVQIRGMKFVAPGGVFDHYFVCLNDRDYVRSEDGSSFTQVEDPSVVVTEGTRFEALTLAYDTFMDFFGFTDDDVHDVLTEGVFLDGCRAERFAQTLSVGDPNSVPEPTEPAPTEPAPIEPEPTEPAPTEVAPNPPATGDRDTSPIGVAAIIAGGCAVIALIVVAVIRASKKDSTN